MRGSCIGNVHLETYLTGCLDIGWDEDVCARWDRGQNHAFGVNSSGKEAPFQTSLPPAVDWCSSNNFKECDDIPSGWFDVWGHIHRFRWSQLSFAVYATPNLELPNCLVDIVVNSGEEVRNDATQTYPFPHLLNRIFYFFECIIPDLQLLITIQWISIIPRDWARVKEVGTLGKETSFHTSVPDPLPHQLLTMMINQEISKRVTMLSLQLGSLIRSIRTWTALSRIFARICGWRGREIRIFFGCIIPGFVTPSFPVDNDPNKTNLEALERDSWSYICLEMWDPIHRFSRGQPVWKRDFLGTSSPDPTYPPTWHLNPKRKGLVHPT